MIPLQKIAELSIGELKEAIDQGDSIDYFLGFRDVLSGRDDLTDSQKLYFEMRIKRRENVLLFDDTAYPNPLIKYLSDPMGK